MRRLPEITAEAYPGLAFRSTRCFVDDVDPRHQFVNRNLSRYAEQFIEFVLEDDDLVFCPLRQMRMMRKGKARTIQIPAFRDKVKGLHHYRLIMERMRPHWPSGVLWGFPGCMKAIKQFRRAYLAPKPLFAFKCDIADFYPSLDHDVVVEQVSQYAPPESTKAIEAFLNLRIITQDGHLERRSQGIPYGNPLSQAIALLVLLGVDRSMERWNRRVRYQRIIDDMLLFSDTLGPLLEAKEALLEQLGRLRLRPNTDKTHLFTRENEAIYLGYRFSNNAISIDPKTILRMKKRIRRWTRPSRYWRQRRRGRLLDLIKAVKRDSEEATNYWVRYFYLVSQPGIFRDLDRLMTGRLQIALMGKRARRCPGHLTDLIHRKGPTGFYRTYARITHGSQKRR